MQDDYVYMTSYYILSSSLFVTIKVSTCCISTIYELALCVVGTSFKQKPTKELTYCNKVTSTLKTGQEWQLDSTKIMIKKEF